jgi:hypothetical protein
LINGFLGSEESGGIMATGLSILPAVFFAAGLGPAPAAAVFPFFAGSVTGTAVFFAAGFTGFSAAGLADSPVVAALIMGYLFF